MATTTKETTKDKETMKKVQAMLQPLGDRLLIKEIDVKTGETMTKSGIIIPGSAHEDKSTKRGKVIAVGSGRITEDGKVVVPVPRVGDTVLYQWGDLVKIEGEEFYMVREPEIMAIIK